MYGHAWAHAHVHILEFMSSFSDQNIKHII